MAIDSRGPRWDGGEHPDAGRLAEYADGVLTGEARTQVEAHLAACEDCRTVVMDAVTFTAEAQPTPVESPVTRVVDFPAPRRRWVIGVGAGMAAAAALFLAVRLVQPEWLGAILGQDGTRPELKELVAAAASEPTRLTEGRLAGFPYRPPPSVTRGAGDVTSSLDIRIAATTIEKRAGEIDTPEMRAALGVAHLAVGNLDGAITALEEAARASSTAAIHNDLAAALLARGASRPEDLPRALDAAERAIASTEPPIEAWFNRALALELLRLRSEATKAWQEYLKRDPSSPWADEARRFLASAPGARLQRGEIDAAIARISPHSADGTRLVAEHPQEIREALEDRLLASWAEQQLSSGAASDTTLTRVREYAAALAVQTGDSLLSGAVAVIDRHTAAGRRDAVTALARAHRDYRDGRRAFSAFSYAKAGPLFERARATLSAVDSPFTAWPTIYTAIVRYQARDLRGAEAMLLRLKETTYPSVAARVHWMLGLIRTERARYDLALDDQRTALQLYDRLGETGNSSFIENLLADTYRQLGEPHLAWRYRLKALERLDGIAQSRTRASLLISAGRAARDEQIPLAGLSFDAEAVAAVRGDSPAACAQVQVRAAASLREVGRQNESGHALAAARDCLASVSETPVNKRLASELLAEEALGTARSRPTEAAEALSGAIDHLRDLQLPDSLSRLLLERGRVYRRLGDVRAARRDLQEGVELFERFRLHPPKESLRVSYFDESWRLFDELIALEALQQHDSAAALATAERARARATVPPPVTGSLPPGTAVIYYATLPDRLLTWVIVNGAPALIDRGIRREDLDLAVDRWERALTQRRPGASLEAARLFDDIIRPASEHLPAGVPLLIVPDGPLHRVAFAALYDSRRAEFLIQRHSVTVTPSLALARRPRGRRSPEDTSLLAIAPPASALSDGLKPLQHADDEVLAVERIYGRAVVLSGDQANAEQAFQTMPGHRIVHFAGHAIANQDFPGLSRLLLAPAAGTTTPSLLTADRIAHLPLSKTDLVVLSACSTAAGRISRGQGPLGLARPFLDAGARAVIATLWDVDDYAARILIERFYAQLRRSGDVARSLRATQLGLIADNDSRLRPPIAWAAFVHIGAISD